MKKLLFTLAIAGFMMSCKKSSPAGDSCTVSNSSIAGKYVITAVTYKANSTEAATDIYAGMNDCQKDDSYTLNTDGSVTISEEANDCGLPPMPGMASSWALDKNNTVLIMGDILDIQSFNCKQLVVTQKNIMTDGDVKTTTYTKQ